MSDSLRPLRDQYVRRSPVGGQAVPPAGPARVHSSRSTRFDLTRLGEMVEVTVIDPQRRVALREFRPRLRHSAVSVSVENGAILLVPSADGTHRLDGRDRLTIPKGLLYAVGLTPSMPVLIDIDEIGALRVIPLDRVRVLRC